MSEKPSIKVTDLLGVAPVARVTERLSDSVLGGAEALLGRVCLPAAEEFGLLLRDKVSAWRQRNLVATALRAKQRLEAAADGGKQAPPRLIIESLQHASWSEDPDVQEMWAGLLISSCTPDGVDDSNWVFINLLNQLTGMQALLLRYACEQSQKSLYPDGIVHAEGLYRTIDEIQAILLCSDFHRIDRELDHLRVLGLIAHGFMIGLVARPHADLRPTTLGLHLYVRCQGSLEDPASFFALKADGDSNA